MEINEGHPKEDALGQGGQPPLAFGKDRQGKGKLSAEFGGERDTEVCAYGACQVGKLDVGNRSCVFDMIGLRAYLTFWGQKEIGQLAVMELVLTVVGWLLQKPWVIDPLSYRPGHCVCVFLPSPSYGICPPNLEHNSPESFFFFSCYRFQRNPNSI